MTALMEQTITRRQVQRFYDRLGKRYELAEGFESTAKRRGLQVLHLVPGLKVVEIGIGTGLTYLELLTRVSPGGFVTGLDLSPVMLWISRRRAMLRRGEQRPALVLGDALRLPYADNSFDRLFSSYTLDLLPLEDIPMVLSEFFRVLQPGGRMALVGMTEPEGLLSQGLIGAWRALYQVEPAWLGGCRPLRLRPFVEAAGFTFVQRWYVSQWGVPSEVVSAVKPPDES